LLNLHICDVIWAPAEEKERNHRPGLPNNLKTRFGKTEDLRSGILRISYLYYPQQETDTISGVAKLEQMIQYEDNNQKQIGILPENYYRVDWRKRNILLSCYPRKCRKEHGLCKSAKNEFLIIGKSIEDKKEILDRSINSRKSGIIKSA